MKTWMRHVLASMSLICAVGAPTAQAEWSNSTTNTFKVADAPGDEHGPVIVPTPDGGCYIGWQAHTTGSTGYHARVQRLDANGVEQWPHNGVPVSAGRHSFTILGGLIMALAPDGGLIVCVDESSDPANPDARQANVQKFSAAGVKLWGTGGANVPVSSGANGGIPAAMCALPDGGCVVGYTVTPPPDVARSYIQLMRYTPSGTPAWAAPKFIFESGVPLVVTCLQPGGADNSFIVLWTRAVNEAALVTRKFDANGNPAAGWAAPITLDPRGLTPRDFPQFLSDGAGGGVYAWRSYANNGFGSGSHAMLQHVLSNGTLKFPQPIPSVDNALVPENTVGRQTASLAYNQAEGTYFIASTQGPVSNGTARSSMVQKFSPTGGLLWTGAGFLVMPEASNMQVGPGQTTVVATPDGGCMVFGTVTRGFSTARRIVYGAKVSTDNFGFPYAEWNKVINSDVTTDKGRLAAALSTTGDALIAFGWEGDIGAARVSAATGAPGVTPIPPSIDADLEPSVDVCPGDTLTLSVQVSGTPNIVYQWQRHYATVPDAWWGLSDGDSSFGCNIPEDGTTYSGTNTPTLTIHNVQPLPPTVTCGENDVRNTDPFFNQYRCIVYNAGSDQVLASSPTLMNFVTTCCNADFDGANGVQVADIFAFLRAWFAQDPRADFDGANGIQVADIFSFLRAWFAGC